MAKSAWRISTGGSLRAPALTVAARHQHPGQRNRPRRHRHLRQRQRCTSSATSHASFITIDTTPSKRLGQAARSEASTMVTMRPDLTAISAAVSTMPVVTASAHFDCATLVPGGIDSSPATAFTAMRHRHRHRHHGRRHHHQRACRHPGRRHLGRRHPGREHQRRGRPRHATCRDRHEHPYGAQHVLPRRRRHSGRGSPR